MTDDHLTNRRRQVAFFTKLKEVTRSKSHMQLAIRTGLSIHRIDQIYRGAVKTINLSTLETISVYTGIAASTLVAWWFDEKSPEDEANDKLARLQVAVGDAQKAMEEFIANTK